MLKQVAVLYFTFLPPVLSEEQKFQFRGMDFFTALLSRRRGVRTDLDIWIVRGRLHNRGVVVPLIDDEVHCDEPEC